MKKNILNIMDTALRDGEQTSGVSFSANDKLLIAQKLLIDLCVDRIEVTSCRSSPEEQKSLKMIVDWAKKHHYTDQIEALSFVDHKKSIDWLLPTGCKHINLLTKGSKKHCDIQLKKTLTQHLNDIEKTLKYAKKQGITASAYLEDWSNGMLHSPDYVWKILDQYKQWPFEKIYLTDTLGILSPKQVKTFICDSLQRYPDTLFEFHAHNDYGLAAANTLEAIMCGISGIHVTINGLGERAGNTNVCEMVPIICDHTDKTTHIREKRLKEVSSLIETLSGKRLADNIPIVGNNVFTQTAGIHADGDQKGSLYESKLSAKRFGRQRTYDLGKLSGKSNVDINLKKLGISLTKAQQKILLHEIIALGDKKKKVTIDDLPFLVSDLFSTPNKEDFKVKECLITSSISATPIANIRVHYKDKDYESSASGDGGYDAFMNALRKITPEMNIHIPKLIDFETCIPPGGKTNALVETIITWDGIIRTRAVAADQVMAAVKATERMINLKIKSKTQQSLISSQVTV